MPGDEGHEGSVREIEGGIKRGEVCGERDPGGDWTGPGSNRDLTGERILK